MGGNRKRWQCGERIQFVPLPSYQHGFHGHLEQTNSRTSWRCGERTNDLQFNPGTPRLPRRLSTMAFIPDKSSPLRYSHSHAVLSLYFECPILASSGFLSNRHGLMRHHSFILKAYGDAVGPPSSFPNPLRGPAKEVLKPCSRHIQIEFVRVFGQFAMRNQFH